MRCFTRLISLLKIFKFVDTQQLPGVKVNLSMCLCKHYIQIWYGSEESIKYKYVIKYIIFNILSRQVN